MLAWGEIAYEAYRLHLLAGGHQTAPWKELSPASREAWIASAHAVRQSCANSFMQEGHAGDFEDEA